MNYQVKLKSTDRHIGVHSYECIVEMWFKYSGLSIEEAASMEYIPSEIELYPVLRYDHVSRVNYMMAYERNEWFNKDKVNGHDIVYVDDLIAPLIQLLNKKGYITEFCCSDHAIDSCIEILPDGYEDDDHEGHDMYISFDKHYDLGTLHCNHSPTYIPAHNCDSIDNINTEEYFSSYRAIIDIIETMCNYVKSLPNLI